MVTVCFNSAATIGDTLQSVLSQDFPEIEHIIVDGGSTDATLEIVQQYSHSIAKLISEPDKGIYDAMNKGIRAATGDAICMLNSDDMYASKRSLSLLALRMTEERTDTVFSDLVYVDRHDKTRKVRYYNSGRFNPARLKYGWMPAHPTFMCRREIYEKWGGYSLDYKVASDFEMMVRLYHRAKVSYSYIPSALVKMRTGGTSAPGLRNSLAINNEIVKACRSYGLRSNLAFQSLRVPAKILEKIWKK